MPWVPLADRADKEVVKLPAENCYFRLLGQASPLFFRCSRAVIPLLSAAVFRGKSHSDQSVTENSGRNPRYQRHVGCSSPLASAKNPRISAASPPRFAANPLHLQQNGHRPPGPTRRHYRDQHRFSLAANPLQMQPDAPFASPHEAGNRCQPPACDLAPAWSVARWKHANQRDALDQGRPG
jgi:hypothetical protein